MRDAETLEKLSADIISSVEGKSSIAKGNALGDTGNMVKTNGTKRSHKSNEPSIFGNDNV